MKTFIEVKLTNDVDKNQDVFTVILDNEELARLVKTDGLKVGNEVLEKFVSKFVEQFKVRFGRYLNR
jgi:hypothetical protein